MLHWHNQAYKSVMSKIQSSANIVPWGHYISWSLSDTVSPAIGASPHAQSRHQQWWAKGHIWCFPKSMCRRLHLFSLELDVPQLLPLWSCLVELTIDRDPHFTLLSDWSYIGIVCWSAGFQVKWCIMLDDMIVLGFNTKETQMIQHEPSMCPTDDGLYINSLEFIDVILHLWLRNSLIPQQPFDH